MNKYDYYGVSYDNEENMILKLSEILGVVFIPHDSSFWGDYFLAKIDGKAECRLFKILTRVKMSGTIQIISMLNGFWR